MRGGKVYAEIEMNFFMMMQSYFGHVAVNISNFAEDFQTKLRKK